jgi:hypothetical protein
VVEVRIEVGSEEARLRAGLRPPLKLHGRFFPYAAFTKTHGFRIAIEGINPTRLTSPNSR